MNVRTITLVAILAGGLGGCAFYHQENPALRMPRPKALSPELTSYAAANEDYPSVGGDILKGTSPHEAAAYDATVGAPPGPPADQNAPANAPTPPTPTTPPSR
jgi:hypothetical protein